MGLMYCLTYKKYCGTNEMHKRLSRSLKRSGKKIQTVL